MQTVIGWRVFALGDHGALLPPFAQRYWSDRRWRPWPDIGPAVAVCLEVAEHMAPELDCTCGLRATEDRSELLDAVRRRCFAGSDRSILEECGVLARVELSGKLLPGVRIPFDDPPTTWRGSQGRVLEVLVAPALAEHAGAVQGRYRVPVGFAVPDWTAAPRPLPAAPPAPGEAAFLADVRAAGFGNKDLRGDIGPLVAIARGLVRAMRGGMTAEDGGRVLFDSAAQPTWIQCRAFILSAIRNFAPELEEPAMDGFVHTEPVTVGESLRRGIRAAVPL